MIGILDDEEKRMRDFGRYAGDILPQKKISALADTGYFRAPASRAHHGQEEGGLYLHSKTTAMLMEELTEKNNLTWKRPQSPRIIGLLHDLCKADGYGNSVMPVPGHGEKSVIMAQRLMELTDEEILCIRFHMGAFEGQQAWDALQRAAGRCCGILWTMQADLMASWVLNV